MYCFDTPETKKCRLFKTYQKRIKGESFMEAYIKVEHVVKKFKDYTALRGISISFEKGKIHGIVGRNGSGKIDSA